MPKKFIIGSLNGQIINSMKNTFQDIFPLVFNNQFQDPNIMNNISLLELNINVENNLNDNYSIDTSHIDIYTSSPSDFRIDSVICDKTKTEQIKKKSTAQSKPIRKLYDKFVVRFSESIKW